MDGDSDAMRVAGTDPNEPRVDFAFVNISRPGYDWKNRNEYVVRSHAMRHVRRRQKAKTAVKIVHKVVDRNLHRAEVQADFTATPSSLCVSRLQRPFPQADVASVVSSVGIGAARLR